VGCGTGALGPGEKFVAILTFNRPIDSQSPLYRDFRGALRWLLRGAEGGGDVEENPGARKGRRKRTGKRTSKQMAKQITKLKVTVIGRITNPEDFNQAFNRILWGVRHRLHDSHGDEKPGTPSGVTVTASPVNWDDEDT